MKHDSTHRYEHTDARDTLIGAMVWKMAFERPTHKRKYKTISFMCFNYIKDYINWIKSILDLNYEAKVKQIIFYL